ncbi:nitroreductase family protein [Ulvibacter antarcticus]|uniref:Putative NAD(P)H nitroreductase n=1 Tax=Ulvibacter antarcticus TaxID=442714 RepID=A0A3L9Z7Y0_9FLAO|nr:nitroreductase [Ulvibacter antarcticus]RMA66395.1 nitroreductase [Ulvibacter antarcticus]
MISEAIKNRRAVFPVQYNNDAISKEEIKEILEAANWAPTHRRTEPWRFKVILGETKGELAGFLAKTYKEKTENFSEFKFQKYLNNPRKAACIIAICMQRDAKQAIPEWEEIAATAMAVQNMWLMAHELKIGAYWGSPGIVKYMDQFFEMADDERCLGFFYMGKYDGELDAGVRATSIEEKTVWL